MKYRCMECGQMYDEEIGDPWTGIKPNTKFANLPWNWTCSECGAEKDLFELDRESEYLKKFFRMTDIESMVPNFKG